jgi:hypothetical protein
MGAQARRGTRRIRSQLHVGRHTLGGPDEPEAKPWPPASLSWVERMENVPCVSPHRPEIAEVSCGEIGVQHRDP